MSLFRVLMMVAVTLLDVAFCTRLLHGAELPAYVADLRKGAAGDSAALDRGMQATEAALAADPKDAQAQVWHGVGLVVRSKGLFETGDYPHGSQLFDRGFKEMDEAAAQAPDDPRVLIPRGATALRATLALPSSEETSDLLRSGLKNYLHIVDEVKGPIQAQVLYGIADAYQRLGQADDATKYFQRVIAEAKGTGYEQNARVWLATKSLTIGQEICAGCGEKP